MSEFTLQALNIAVGSIAFEREALMLRIESVSAQVENDEQLSEQVLLVEQALGEFRDAYNHALRSNSGSHPSYATVVAEGIRSAREYFKR